jgi:hypothetical protein
LWGRGGQKLLAGALYSFKKALCGMGCGWLKAAMKNTKKSIHTGLALLATLSQRNWERLLDLSANVTKEDISQTWTSMLRIRTNLQERALLHSGTRGKGYSQTIFFRIAALQKQQQNFFRYWQKIPNAWQDTLHYRTPKLLESGVGAMR